MSDLSREDVERVARLARLDLSEEETLRFGKDLGAIVDYMQRLRAADTSQVAATLGVQPHSNVFREDHSRPGLGAEAILSNAPKAEGGSFQIPRILEEA